MDEQRIMHEIEKMRSDISALKSMVERIDGKVNNTDHTLQVLASGYAGAYINSRKMGM